MAFKYLQRFLFSLLLLSSVAAPVIFGRRHLHSHKLTQPLLFPEHLQGSRKGDNLGGIHNLKIYLQHFGYLNSVQTDSDAAAEKDIFDDDLESAIKAYQRNFNLNASGILDLQTLSVMSMRRCGIADIINGSSRMRSGSHIHPDYAFAGYTKWPSYKSHLTYTFINNFPSYYIEPVVGAFNTWAGSSKFTFSQTSDVQTADVKISFERGDHGDGHPFYGVVLAHSFYPTDGRLHFNVDQTWTWGAAYDSFDVQTVGLHELGHILGLAHSSDADAVMFPIINPASTKGLNYDDIEGIHALYS